MKIQKKFIILFLPSVLLGCSKVDIQHYQNDKPLLTINNFFNGPIKAWGIFQNRQENIKERFYVEMIGSWKGNQGTLDETFHYADGRVQKRLWKINLTDQHHFTVTANDVIGTGSGEQYGNVIHMRYIIKVTSGGKDYELNADDWMYAVQDHAVINKSALSKYGFTVGNLTGFIQTGLT